MKIYPIGDLHIDIGAHPKFAHKDPVDGVLLLLGDIAEYKFLKSESSKTFLKRLSSKFTHVLAIKGNHEIYGQDMETIDAKLYELYRSCGIEYLNRSSVTIGNHVFIGATLWTNYNNQSPSVMMEAAGRMNDFRAIRYFGNRLTPECILSEHQLDLTYIQQRLTHVSPVQKVVIMTHHAPLMQSARMPGREPALIDHAYASNLEHVIEGVRNPLLWCNGHTHTNMVIPYRQGDGYDPQKIVVTHCRGYGKQNFNSPYFEDWLKEFTV